YINFRIAESRCRVGLKNKKIDSFKQFCEKLNKDSNPNFIWNTVQPPSFEDHAWDPFLDLPFTLLELTYVIKNLEIKSSPGFDSIDYKIISALLPDGLEYPLNIYNDIFSSGTSITDWKKYIMFFIPKADPDKFCPISLALCLAKIMEKMIYNRLNWWLEYHTKFHKSQFGFGRNRSCIDNLSILYTNILKSFAKGSSTAVAFLDVKSAFDNVLWDVLLKKLKALGIPLCTLSFIYNIIAEREVHCKFGNIDEILWTFKGLPQGSVLSPILYTIYTSELEDALPPQCNIIQYADDIAIFSDLYSIPKAIESLETSLNKISRILHDLGLSLSPSKSKFCIFKKSSSHLNISHLHLNLNEDRIPRHHSVKFLGMILSSDLKWNKHVNHIWNTCQNPLKILNCLRHTWWGADPSILLGIYRALIRSRLEYGGFLLHNLSSETYQKLNRIQYKALRLALGYRTSTPINVILAESKEPTLDLRFDYLCRMFLTKTLALDGHPLNLHLDDFTDLLKNSALRSTFSTLPKLLLCYHDTTHFSANLYSEDRPHSGSLPFQSFTFLPKVDLTSGYYLRDSRDPNACMDELFCNLENEYLHLFTDGSKSPDNPFAGLAFSSVNEEYSGLFRASAFLPIFSVEALGKVNPHVSNIKDDIKELESWGFDISLI
ncbi:PREDICTED: RNA-directed DNA polymerase from mobile element jockey-like, partial [Dinoponera quadriceps]|uniref:RNA-directed DNA polymerase from mobile element jockey-like n=1 Tax=Dinoponera quadriceps TaxID=609295 RepID=A0A6P3X056_DINQU